MDFEAERICDSCEENEGCVLCPVCNAWLCEECDATTHEIPGFSAHKRQEGCEAPGFCSNHHTRATALCENCKKLCCRRCMTDPQHRGHRFTECAAAGATYERKREELVQTLAGAQELGQSATEGIQAEIDALGESRQKALDAIEDAFGRIADALDARKGELIDLVTKRADEEEERLQTIYNDLDTKCVSADQSLEDFRAQQEAAQENGGGSSGGGGALIAMSAEMERLIGEITTDIQTTLNNAATKSIAINFAKAQGEKKKEKKEEEDEDDDDEEDGSSNSSSSSGSSMDLEEIVGRFGVVTFDPKYDAKRILCVKSEGAGKLDLDDTSVGLTWESAPVPVLNLAKSCDAFLFAVDQKDPATKEFREAWTGKETSTRCTGLVRGKRTDFRVRGYLRGTDGKHPIWTSNTLTVIGGGFPGTWKEDPDNYSLNEARTIAEKTSSDSGHGIAIGSVPMTEGGVFKWRFVITKYVGSIACVGVAPADIDVTLTSAYEKVGYYICTCDAELHSGPPYDYSHKSYGHCKIDSGEFIDVTVDMVERTISFNCKGKDCGIAYKNIPTDKPLVPAVIFHKKGEAVELLQHPDDDGDSSAPLKLPEESAWKACPASITDYDKAYTVSSGSPRKAVSNDFSMCTVIGNTPIPMDGIYSWKVRIAQNINDGEGDIFVGVAPAGINQNGDENQAKCGWYMACCGGVLCSGPPHSLSGMEYAPRRDGGLKGGETIGVVMNMLEGSLSFVVNGVKRKNAYESIPTDKPLVPAAVFFCCSNTVELII